MGLLGPILWLIWVSVLLSQGWKIVKKLRGTVYFPLGFAIWWYAVVDLILFIYMTVAFYQNFVNNCSLGCYSVYPNSRKCLNPSPFPDTCAECPAGGSRCLEGRRRVWHCRDCNDTP